jgi:hypothetical protein
MANRQPYLIALKDRFCVHPTFTFVQKERIAMSTAPSRTPATVSLADEEAVRRILVDTLFGLWATVNNLTRLRPSRHERYRVTVFGSARTEPEHWVYAKVKQMCSALSAMDCDSSLAAAPA